MKTLLPFDLVYATSVADASSRLAAAKGNAMLVAGGTDTISVLKSRILPSYPQTLISLLKVTGLDTISVTGGALKLGALAKVINLANSTDVKSAFPLLAAAAASVASPQVRNMGTVGGNLAQHVRCWYYRYPNELGGRILCLRKGGSVCYAQVGDNRYHSIFGGPKGCYAASVSDIATALLALNASVVTNTRTIPIDSFFDSLTGTVLGANEIITEVDVPAPASGTKQTFLKFRKRAAIDFAIVSVATMLTMSGTTCTAARIALGGVAPTPLRSTDAESAIVGKTLDANAAAAAATAAVAKASPMPYNAYKVPILKSLLTTALTS